jgi:threonine/homoserine efflux transporter RhtA
LYGLRTARNFTALALAVIGVFLLIDVKWSTDPLGLFWAFLNGALFVGYIVLGHKISEGGASGGVERLGAAMAMAFFLKNVNGCGPEAPAASARSRSLAHMICVSTVRWLWLSALQIAPYAEKRAAAPLMVARPSPRNSGIGRPSRS